MRSDLIVACRDFDTLNVWNAFPNVRRGCWQHSATYSHACRVARHVSFFCFSAPSLFSGCRIIVNLYNNNLTSLLSCKHLWLPCYFVMAAPVANRLSHHAQGHAPRAHLRHGDHACAPDLGSWTAPRLLALLVQGRHCRWSLRCFQHLVFQRRCC